MYRSPLLPSSYNSLYPLAPRDSKSHSGQGNTFKFEVPHHAQQRAVLSPYQVLATHLLARKNARPTGNRTGRAHVEPKDAFCDSGCVATEVEATLNSTSSEICSTFISAASGPTPRIEQRGNHDHPVNSKIGQDRSIDPLVRLSCFQVLCFRRDLPRRRRTLARPSWTHAYRTCPRSFGQA